MQTTTVNPKVMSLKEMYGSHNAGDWEQGLLEKLLTKCNSAESEGSAIFYN